MRRLPALLALSCALALATAHAEEAPFFRFNGRALVGPGSDQSSTDGSSAASPAFTAPPAAASFQPGGPVSASPPATSGTSSATTYALLRNGADISGSLGSLCTGLGFSTASGTITGTPSGYCSLTGLTYQANTPGQPTATSAPFDLVVRSAYAVTTQPGPMTLPPGATQSTAAAISGSPFGGLTWSIRPPASDPSPVPAWISMAPGSCGVSNLSCQVNATPPASAAPGTYPASGGYVIAATDASGTSAASQAFSVVVQSTPVSVSQAPLSYSLYPGDAVTTSVVSATGGTKPYAYTLQTLSGTPAQNVSINQSNGAVTFTGASIGTWTYRVRVASSGDPSNFADAATTTVVTQTKPTGLNAAIDRIITTVNVKSNSPNRNDTFPPAPVQDEDDGTSIEMLGGNFAMATFRLSTPTTVDRICIKGGAGMEFTLGTYDCCNFTPLKTYPGGNFDETLTFSARAINYIGISFGTNSDVGPIPQVRIEKLKTGKGQCVP